MMMAVSSYESDFQVVIPVEFQQYKVEECKKERRDFTVILYAIQSLMLCSGMMVTALFFLGVIFPIYPALLLAASIKLMASALLLCIPLYEYSE